MLRLMPPMDAIFLAVEKPTNPMHIAGLHLFTPPPEGDRESVRAMFAGETGTIQIAEYFSRRAVQTWGGRWNWLLEPTIDLRYHLREHVLPTGAGMSELLELCAALHSEPLRRDRPLWQAHLISGLSDGRFALYFKMHHALGDGQQSQRLLRQTLSRDESRRGAPPPWAAADPVPATPGGGTRPGLFSEVAGLASVVGRTLLGPGIVVPQTVLNPPRVSGQRRLATRSWPLDRIRAVGKAVGASTNDVVLTLCGGALRRYLTGRNSLPKESLVAMVPVALRTNGPLGDTGTHQAAGNSVGALLCQLGTDEPDAGQRLSNIGRQMQQAKLDHNAMTPTQVLASTAITVGPLILQPRRARPPFNLIISNVTSSPVPLFFNGAHLDEVYPLSIPMDGQALNITCTIYARRIAFGLTCCPAHVGDPERLLAYFDDELALLEAGLNGG